MENRQKKLKDILKNRLWEPKATLSYSNKYLIGVPAAGFGENSRKYIFEEIIPEIFPELKKVISVCTMSTSQHKEI